MITLRIEKEFEGLGLLEVMDLIDQYDSSVEVKWSNTEPELRALARYRTRSVVLVVEDLDAMEQAASTVGTWLAFDPATIRQATVALLDASVSNWRGFCHSLGTDVSRGVLIAIANKALLNGCTAKPFRRVLDCCLFEDVAPVDMDVLIGLKTL